MLYRFLYWLGWFCWVLAVIESLHGNNETSNHSYLIAIILTISAIYWQGESR